MNENTTKGEKMDKERIAELRLLEKHLRASGQMTGAVIGELLDDLEAALARAEGAEARNGYDLVAHLARQREFSKRTFGPGPRTKGVLDHLQKELAEVALDPSDITEWIDLVLLALDGAWRNTGLEPAEIAAALEAKQAKNESREWPDWRTMSPDKAIEHNRSQEPRP